MKIKVLALAIACTISTSSWADIEFNGFGSVRATSVSSDGSAPLPGLPKDGDLSFKSESRFALQARADLGDKLAITLQFTAEGVNEFDVEARWAYLSYQLDDNHIINAGRLANPIFHQSEYEKVGYAHNFARLPSTVYAAFAFSTIEGISLDSSFEVGEDMTLNTKLLYGNWDGKTFIASTQSEEAFSLPDIFSVNLTLSGEWWKVFAGGFVSDMVADKSLDPVFIGGARALADPGSVENATASELNELDDAVAWTGKTVEYAFVGFGIDYNNWLIDSEITSVGVADSSDAINTSYYVSVGKRFDNITITIHTEDRKQSPDFSPFNNVSNSGLRAGAEKLNTRFGATEFSAEGITLRYDFHPSATFKVDYIQGENTTDNIGDYSIISAGVDFVF